jgi:hypothetical protein
MVRSVFYLKPVLLIVFGLVFMLSSCDRGELSDNDKPLGELVAVSVNLLGISEGNAEDVTRSAAAEPITETVSLGDGLLMEMSLEADPAAELRATLSPLGENKKFVLIAVKAADSTYVSHAGYTVIGSVPVIDAPGDSVHVSSGGTYRFICVSYNSETSPVGQATGLVTGQVPKFTGISGNVDLLYWDSGEVVVNERQVLSVRFEHKFSQLSLKVNCKYNGWPVTVADASKITLVSRANTATLFAKGSLVSSGAVADVAFVWPSSGTDTVISNPSVLCMAGITPAIRLSQYALTVNGAQVPSAAGSTDYSFSSAAPLVAGKHYTLTLKLKTPKFANSNIYWDGSKLTFDAYIDSTANPTGYVANKEQQQKQGVLFKWGSLIGISAPGRAAFYNYTWDNDTASIFVPHDPTNPVTNHSSWTRMTNKLASDSAKWAAGWTAIPYVNDNPVPYGTNTNYLNTLHNSTAHISAYKGDICHYLDEDYRMPIAAEFGGSNAAWDKWTILPHGGAESTNAERYLATDYSGRTPLPVSATRPNYCVTLKVNNMLFPASGTRDSSSARLYDVGFYGDYWSSSASDATRGYHLHFYYNGLDPVRSGYSRFFGYAVRCVLRE